MADYRYSLPEKVALFYWHYMTIKQHLIVSLLFARKTVVF